jgi:predicted nucleic acid-binding protein
MLKDIVIDTNVLVHAHNTDHAYSADASALATALLEPSNETALKVDPGFHPVEAKNRSRIIGEYLEKLVPGMVGYHLVQELGASGRIAPVLPTKDRNLKEAVRRLVKDPFDRVFLLTARLSDDKTLVSHDDHAFPDDVRVKCEAKLSVSVCDAPDAAPLVAADSQ